MHSGVAGVCIRYIVAAISWQLVNSYSTVDCNYV